LRWPPAWRYGLATAVTALVVAAAWWAGGDGPVPGWAGNLLVPALGWLVLIILGWWLFAHR
jgi:hypothetical protein